MVTNNKIINHEHANSFNNNLYVDLLNKLREKNLNDDFYDNNQLIVNNRNYEAHSKKRTIELNQIPRLINIYNNSYKSFKNIKNRNEMFSSIEHNDSLSSNNNNETNKKIDMMKASSNFYIRERMQKNKLGKITPINLRNKNMLLNTNYNFNKKLDSIKNDDTIINSKRNHIKVRTKSFSGKPFYEYSKNISKINSSEKNYYYKKNALIKNNTNKEKKIFSNINKKMNKGGEIRHNYSYSSFNNKNKIESLIKNLIEPEKSLKNTIPFNIKKSSNTLISNSKVSSLHKKIPIPSSFGQKIFHKRMNGFMSKKLRNGGNNSFSISINNNSISNSSITKNHIVNNNTSMNKNLKKDEFNENISNSKLNNGNNSINVDKKKNFKSILSKNPNFTFILKKLNDFSKNNKKNISIEDTFGFLSNKNKNNNLDLINKDKPKKFTVKNNLLKNQIKKIGEKKNISDNLKNIKKKEHNENKDDYSNILNNNILLNKKFRNNNHKNKYNNDAKKIKNSIGNFSYPSYNSTTSSGGKNNNK